VREVPARERQADLRHRGQVTFTYSNPGWEINLDFVGAAGSPGLSVNCRRIPDGVRYFTQSAQASETTNQAAPLTAAFALPIGYPPPEQLGAVALLAEPLPGPELPTLDSGRMRRFLFLQCPGGRQETRARSRPAIWRWPAVSGGAWHHQTMERTSH